VNARNHNRNSIDTTEQSENSKMIKPRVYRIGLRGIRRNAVKLVLILRFRYPRYGMGENEGREGEPAGGNGKTKKNEQLKENGIGTCTCMMCVRVCVCAIQRAPQCSSSVPA
jgi:hypothetical protein